MLDVGGVGMECVCATWACSVSELWFEVGFYVDHFELCSKLELCGIVERATAEWQADKT